MQNQVAITTLKTKHHSNEKKAESIHLLLHTYNEVSDMKDLDPNGNIIGSFWLEEITKSNHNLIPALNRVPRNHLKSFSNSKKVASTTVRQLTGSYFLGPLAIKRVVCFFF